MTVATLTGHVVRAYGGGYSGTTFSECFLTDVILQPWRQMVQPRQQISTTRSFKLVSIPLLSSMLIYFSRCHYQVNAGETPLSTRR